MLFDTTILIAHLRGDLRASELLLSVPAIERRISVLSRLELEGGMRSAEKNRLSQLFSSLQLIPVSEIIAGRAGEFLRKYRRSHHSVDVVDYVIAATAEVHDAPLQTLNVKHFPMFDQLESPFKD